MTYFLVGIMFFLLFALGFSLYKYDKVKKREELLYMAFNISREGVYYMDLHTQQTRVSPGYYSLLGYGPDEIRFTPQIWSSLIHEEDRERVLDTYHGVENKSDTYISVQYRIRTKNGTYLWVLDRSRVVKYDGKGSPVCSIGTITDIQKLKKAEEELFIRNEELQTSMEDLKASQTKLVEMEKMASLGFLTTGIAYELNNSLNYVKGNVHPLRQDIAELFSYLDTKISQRKEVREIRGEIDILLDGIASGAQKSYELMRSLRMFSEDQNMDQAKQVDVNVTLRTTLRLLQKSIPPHVQIHTELADIPYVAGWPGKLSQVFTVLLKNALESVAREPDGNIYIHTLQQSNEVVALICDDGRIIRKEMKEKIFEPFFSTKKGYNGLGLPIARSIMESHQGSLELENRKDLNAFKLTFRSASGMAKVPSEG